MKESKPRTQVGREQLYGPYSQMPQKMIHATMFEAMEQVANAHGVPEAAALIGRRARELGFEHWAYGLRLPLPFTGPRFLLVSNYEKRWVARYHDQGYISIDPTVRHGIRSFVPQTWDDQTFKSTPELWDEARSFGLCVGWAQSCFDGEGKVGMLSLGRSSEKLSLKEVVAREPLWRWLVNIAHLELSKRLERQHGNPTALTPRQIEVLQWTADGKTAEQIAEILGLSEYTIQFHIHNAIARLGAANKFSAVARAASLGLLK